jgi:hypothetical protein
MSGTNSALPTLAATIDRLGTALNNLALAAANDTTVLQQLTASNLALTTSSATLTVANKKLSEALAKAKVLCPPATTPGARQIWGTASYQQTFPWELLLDSWPLVQPASHKCDLRWQRRGSLGQCNSFQHDGREREGQGMEHSWHLTVGKFSNYR